MPDTLARPKGVAEVPQGAVVAAAVASIVGAWIAAGSIGLCAHPLQVALTWTALAIAIVAAWPPPRQLPVLGLVLAVMVWLPLADGRHGVHGVLAVAAVVAMLAAARTGLARRLLLVTAVSVATLAIYRLAYQSIPIVWSLANAAGHMLGWVVQSVTGWPLWVGATFGGVDFLVLMVTLLVGWLLLTPAPRRYRAIYAGVAILLAHALYLVVVALSTDLLEKLPSPPPLPQKHPYTPPPWHWSSTVRVLLPWNVPALAAAFYAVLVTVMFRWTAWSAELVGNPAPAAGDPRGRARPARQHRLPHAWATIMLAVAIPVVTVLCLGRSDLRGKTIVVNREGYLDWRKPQHGHYGRQSAGLYGMLPIFVESLGGRLVRSADLSDDDLRQADILMLINPTRRWTPEQRQRIWDYVQRGGALLLAAGPATYQDDAHASHNEILSPTGLRVRQDVALSESESWQHACQIPIHPVTAEFDDGRPSPASDWGASIRVGWAGRPLLVGQWGWSDPGSDAVLTGGGRFDAGEQLGDVVLAAEQPLGAGTVAVLGDGSILANEGIVRHWPFVGRLLHHLAGTPGTAQRQWRQILGILLGLMLVASLAWRPSGQRVVVATVTLAVALAVCCSIPRRANRVVPCLPAGSAAELAYIDGAHLEAYSDLTWSFDGVDGLGLTLMRNGFLPLRLPEMTAERIQHAQLVISIAPAARWRLAERRWLTELVSRGGVLICTVGAEEASASEALLDTFGLQVPPSPVPTGDGRREPEPMGHVRSVYLNGPEHRRGQGAPRVRFYAGWPVDIQAADGTVLVRGRGSAPIVVARSIGQGTVILIGDTGFAMNKNLEYIGGEPFDGRYENADFWRWLIAHVTDRPAWVPPPASPAAAEPDTDAVEPGFDRAAEPDPKPTSPEQLDGTADRSDRSAVSDGEVGP